MRLPARLAVSRHGIFYFRISIPACLRHRFDDKAELRKSLGTRDPREAKAMAYGLSSTFLQAFGKVRHMSEKPDAQAWMDEITAKYRAAVDQLEKIGGYGKIRIELPRGGTVECDTVEEFEAVKAMLADSTGDEMPEFKWTPEPAPTPKKRTTGGVSFSHVMEEAFADAASGWTERTVQSYRQKCNDFAAFVQNPPIASITREDITRYKRHLQKRLSAKSVNNYIGAIAAVFEKAMKERICTSAPTSSQNLAFNKEEVMRDAFLPDHLKAIFAPARMTELQDPADYWFPLLSLFSGLRVSEIGQLRAVDIHMVNGVPAINVYKSKTPAGIRVIPIAKPLLDLGFLEYVEEVKELRAQRVFPHLNLTKQGYGKNVSKRFSGLLKALGIKERLSFHSFRHTFVEHLLEAEIDEAVQSRYIGHKYSSTLHTIYGKGKVPFHALISKVLPHISFTEVNIDKIRSPRSRFVPFLEHAIGEMEAAKALSGPDVEPVEKPARRGRGVSARGR
jgi:integrase